MARERRTSSVLDTSQERLAGLKSIDLEPSFGGDMTVAAFTGKVNGFTGNLGTYNQHMAALDDEQNAIDAEEEELRDWNSRWLSAIEAKYGRDSSEYEMVGGTRTSDRRKPGRPRGVDALRHRNRSASISLSNGGG
jgi:hypothetical protein